jgi:UPF0716 protein FxsA
VALLVLLFVIVPIAELYVLIQVGQEIGALETIGLLILVSVVGAWLVKATGLGVLRRLQDSLAERRTPTNEIVDGFLLLFAGLLFVVPGFLTDVLAVLLLLPPTRAVARGILKKRFAHRTTVVRRFGGPPRRPGSGPGGPNGPGQAPPGPPSVGPTIDV